MAEREHRDPSQEALQKQKKKGRAVWLGLAVAAAVVVLAAVGVCAAAHGSQRIFSGTEVLGVELGGLTRDQAQERWLERGAQACADTKIDLTVDGGSVQQVTLAELGVSVRAEDAAAAAWDSSHSGNFFRDGWHLVRRWVEKTSAAPRLTVDEAALTAEADTLAAALSYETVDGSYRLEDGKTDGFYVTKPLDGRTVDGAALTADLAAALGEGIPESVACRYEMSPAAPLDLDAVNEAIGGDKVEAGYNKVSGGLITSRPGVAFDVESAKALVDAAEPGSELEIPAAITYPTVTTEQLEKVLFRDVLGSYTTSVGGSSERRGNVKLSAAACSGYILNPGDEFNYNAVVGQRTAARGYKAAPAYVGGKTVDEIGGGICQTSSTLYYAALLSNLEIVKRDCHRYAPSYITFGCDATVSWGGPDFIFRNNTNYPIKIVTSYYNNNLTVKIYGTNVDGTYVRMVSKTLSSTDWKTVYQETDELAGGVQRVEQYPYTGYYVKTWRNVYSANGTLLSSTFEAVSDYKSRDKIVLVGKAAPAPDPTPEPNPDPAPEPTPDPAPTPDPGEAAAG